MNPKWASVGGSRIVTWLAVWILAIVVLGVAVIPPERCGTPRLTDIDEAAAATTSWLVVNQRDDSRWRYEFDRDSASDLGGYNIVRHAGVMEALYQRNSWIGDESARTTAERGLEWIERELVVAGDGIAVREGRLGSTGGSALLTAALLYRREATGATDRDPLISALVRFLLGQQTAEGAILAGFDLAAGAPVPGEFSKFFTGEAMWALAMAGNRFSEPEWTAAAFRTLDYVALERDEVEDDFPPNDDHWAGYALGELAPHGLEPHHRDYLRRLAGLWSGEVRFDSQRTGEGLNRVVRGGLGRGAQQASNLEGMSGLWRAAVVDEGLADVREDLTDRIVCAATMMAARQVTADEAANESIPSATAGAWFAEGVTRMDIQQHALSGLMAARFVLEDADTVEGDSGTDLIELVAAMGLIALLVTPRRRGRSAGVGTDPDRRLMVGAAVTLTAAALLGPTVLDAIEVTTTSARLAVGVLIVAVVAAGWAGIEARPYPLAAVYPPAVVTVAVLAADLSRLAAVVAAVGGLALARLVAEVRQRNVIDLVVVSARDSVLVLAAAATVVAGTIGL